MTYKTISTENVTSQSEPVEPATTESVANGIVTKKPRWTDKQQEAIDVRGERVLVAAAAGSGKTAVLTERIRKLVVDERVPVPSLLVLTFTDAAAGEMRRRIEDALSAAMDADGDDTFISEQIRHLRSASISTFHSFALTVLRNYYYIIGKEPALRVCDEFRAALMKQEALDRLFENRFASGDSGFTDFLVKYATGKNEDVVRAMIDETYKFIRSLPEPFEWLDDAVSCLGMGYDEYVRSVDFQELCAYIKSEIGLAIADVARVGAMLSAGGAPFLYEKNAIDLAELRGMADVFADGAGFDRMPAAMDYSFQRFVAKKDEKENYAYIKEAVTAVRDGAKDRLKALRAIFFTRPLAEMIADVNDTHESAAVFAGLVREFHDIYAQIKEDDGVIDFNDIEHFALAIMKDAAVLAELRAKYRHILVDEYQDSNYVQESLIRAIAQDELFMVGDVKQSIYGFRHAEPEIFAEKYRKYPGEPGSRRVDLNTNFRSKLPVIDAVNGVFTHLMKEGAAGGIAYDEDAALRLGVGGYDEKYNTDTELFVVDSAVVKNADGESGDSDSLGTSGATDLDSYGEIADLEDIEREALVAARVIKKAYGNTFYDAKQGRERTMGYGDMVVLIRDANASGPAFVETLLGEGIYAHVSSGDGYLDTVEIETFMNLLRVIDNMRNDVPLVSALYSPVFGFTTDELAEIRMSARERKKPFYRAFLECARGAGESSEGESADKRNGEEGAFSEKYIGADSALAKKCRGVMARIAGWRHDEAFMELSDFIWFVLKDSGWYDYAGALAGGDRRQANLRAMTLRAAEYGAARTRGLFGFLKYIDSVVDRKLPIPQAKLVTEGEDVVRIMTVHKSKGLEYPLVIIAGLGKSLNRTAVQGRMAMHRSLGIAFTWESPESNTYRKTLPMNLIAKRKAADERTELLRVLYVAMTRAQDRLVMIGSGKNIGELAGGGLSHAESVDVYGAKSFLDMILPLAGEASIKVSVVTPSELSRSIAEQKLETLCATERLALLESENDARDGSPNHNFAERKTEIADLVDRRLSFVYPHEAAARLKSKYSVSELNRKTVSEFATDGVPELNQEYVDEFTVDGVKRVRYYIEESEAAADEDSGMAIDYAERGVALHKALEKLDYEAAVSHAGDIDWFLSYLDRLVTSGYITAEQRGIVAAHDLARFAASNICARAASSKSVRRETPFNYRMEMDAEQIIVQGVIDLFFEEDGEIVLVDYKSGYGSRAKEYYLGQYGEQLRIYRNALEAITEKRVKEALLYLTEPGEVVELPRESRE